MPEELINNTDLCQASIRTEEEIGTIQSELGESLSWMRHTIRWVEVIKDPTRFKLVYLLRRYEQLCVCDLANILGVSSPAISQHLRKLKDMDLVRAAREKQTLFYSLRSSDFVPFLDSILGADLVLNEDYAVPALS